MLGGEFEVSKNIMLIDMFVEMMKEYYICYYFYIVLTTIADRSIARTNVWNFNNWSRKCFFASNSFSFVGISYVCFSFGFIIWILFGYFDSIIFHWNLFEIISCKHIDWHISRHQNLQRLFTTCWEMFLNW